VTRRTLAVVVAGLVSLSLVGVALANEPDGPLLGSGPDELCEEATTDEATTDDSTADEGTTDEGTEGSTTDEGTEGTTDQGTESSTGEGAEGPSDDCVPAGGTDGSEEGTDGDPEATVQDLGEEELDEEADLDEGERPMNHGWYVSEATKTCPESGRERGECISAVAKSDLGKRHADGGETDGAPEGEGTSSPDDGEGDGAKAKPAKGAKSGGGSKGRGARG
jgi:hypothetical protein